MKSRLRLFLPLAIFVLLAALLFRGLSLDPQELPSALIDKTLPAFSLPRLGSDQLISEGDLKGPLLLNVWATWCISCRVEHPYLQRLSEEGVRIVGINYKDREEAALQWLSDYGDPYAFSVFDAAGTLGLDLGVYGAPETYFVDAHGVIRYRHVGVIDERLWRGRLEPIYRAMPTGKQDGMQEVLQKGSEQ